jgi:hypothetical protein
MAMKLKIAASLSRDAEVIMLDEPLNGIDLNGRDQIIYVIKQAALTKNPIIMVSSHLFDELEPIVNKVVMLLRGRLIVNGNIQEIRQRTGRSISDLYREVYSGNFSSVSPLGITGGYYGAMYEAELQRNFYGNAAYAPNPGNVYSNPMNNAYNTANPANVNAQYNPQNTPPNYGNYNPANTVYYAQTPMHNEYNSNNPSNSPIHNAYNMMNPVHNVYNAGNPVNSINSTAAPPPSDMAGTGTQDVTAGSDAYSAAGNPENSTTPTASDTQSTGNPQNTGGGSNA